MSGNTKSTIPHKRSSIADEFYFYDKLPALLRKYVRESALNLSSQALYEKWYAYSINGGNLEDFIQKSARGQALALYKESSKIWGFNHS